MYGVHEYVAASGAGQQIGVVLHWHLDSVEDRANFSALGTTSDDRCYSRRLEELKQLLRVDQAVKMGRQGSCWAQKPLGGSV